MSRHMICGTLTAMLRSKTYLEDTMTQPLDTRLDALLVRGPHGTI
jgi:hypothetical protein